MDDALKHTRLIHYSLVGAAMTALVLVFTKHSDIAERYDLAIEQMKLVRGLVGHDWKEGGDTARNLFKPNNLASISEIRATLKERALRHASSVLSSELREKMQSASRAQVEASWKIPVLEQSDLPRSAPIKEILAYFDSIPVLVVVPDIGELMTKSVSLSTSESSGHRVEIEVTAGIDLPGYVSRAGWSSGTENVPATIVVRLLEKAKLLREEKIPMEAHVQRLPPFTQKDVLLRSFRYFDQVIPQVQDLTPDQAIFALEEKALNLPDATSFLGVSIPRSMSLIGIMVIVGLLFALYRSVAHLVSVIASDPGSAESVRRFSWIAVFPDRFSRYFTIVSVAILPVSAVAFLGIASLMSLASSGSLFGGLLLLIAIASTLPLSQGVVKALDELRHSSVAGV